MEVETSITPNSKELPEQEKYNVNFKDCNNSTLVVGDGSSVFDPCSRRLELEKVISMEVETSIPPNSKELPEQAKYNVHFKDCNNSTLVVGDGSSVFDHCSQLELEKVISTEVKPTAIITSIFTTRGRDRSGSKRKQGTITFTQRKRRTDSKSRSSDSEEEIARFGLSEFLSAVFSDEKSLKNLYGIVNQLHPLRDCGNWKEFEMAAELIQLERKGDLASEIFVLLEQSVAVSYQKDFERSEAMVFKGLEMLKKANVDEHHFLLSTAHINLTGFYRRQNKHEEAERSLEIARQNASHVKSKYLRAIVFYEWASNLTKYISLLPSSKPNRNSLVEDAEYRMKRCISLCVQVDKEGVYIRKHHFGLPKLALMGLNCRTRPARSEPVDLSTINDARNCIKILEDKYEDDLSQGTTIQLLVAKSDLSYRLEDFRTAEIDAILALETAKRFGFSLEIDPIKERLEDISRLIKLEEGKIAPEARQFGNSSPSLSSSTFPSRRNSPSSSDCEMPELYM